MADIVLPAKVKILGKDYSINFRDELMEAMGLMGRVSSQHQLIELDGNQAFQQVQDTALHEVLHAISSLQALELEENTVIRLTTALMDLIKSNKKFLRFLMES